ncbi:DUF1990 domain-containing protein [Arthrobacter agilis]|uniref:DUF1990 family protein n=1 Tax=Arthrobacter agilis TaxID=37921 RepID=UPI000B358877|nr:DUF1990 domain-containing protein [Arthrobacter agilis]OUM45066.1 DUF1990 domain-containing protein [Arthrobacter agilis]PPB46867.1 DUF1990 domain-containing protein [Arthrobacter agilis]TPV23542.1 DUF1990 domain-containing protein [Arthrobacter agilis]
MSTSPESSVWPITDAGFRRSEVTAVIGRGDECWQRAATAVLCWAVKTRSGFRVKDARPVEQGAQLAVTVRFLGFTVVEPVEVVTVVRSDERAGFSYRTLPGHPVAGEEAFIVHRRGDEVRLTIRSLTRPAARQPWRALFPLLLVAQRLVRRRYVRALR